VSWETDCHAEVKKKSNELSAHSTANKSVHDDPSDHGFFKKWHIQNDFPLYVLTHGSFHLSATVTIHLW